MTTHEQPARDISAAVSAVLDENARARAALIEALDAVPAERRREGWFGPSRWSLHDIVAHLVAWQDGFAAALELVARGERPAVPGYDSDAPDADDRFNARSVEAASGQSWETLVARMRAARERHEAAVRALVGTVPADRFVEGRAARRLASQHNHDREHTPDILEWRREQGI